MEKLELKINKPELYNAVLKDSLPDFGDIEIITKHGVTKAGQAGVMITFSVQMPNGEKKRVQTCTTMSLFRAVTAAFQSTYTDRGFPVEGVGGADVFDDPNIHEG